MAADDEILVAVAGPMTGQYAAFGRAMKVGGEYAVAKINADGGIAGRKVQLLVEDDACDKAKAISIAQRLVADKVALVVGHHCASASLAAAPVYAAAGIIMISPGTTDPQFTDKRAGPTIFRLAPRSDREGAEIGTYIARKFAGKRVALLHDRTVVGIQLAADTKKAMNVAGLVEAIHTGFIAGERDYRPLARDIRTHRIDVVFLGAYPTESALILRALRDEGLGTVLVGSSLLSSGEFIKPAHDLLNSRVIQPDAGPIDVIEPASSPIGPHDQSNERSRAFTQSYAAVQAWAQAAGTFNVGLTAKVLQSATFDTVSGRFDFDKKGDATLQFYKMFAWKDGDNMIPAP